MARIVLSSLAATAAGATMLVSLAGPAQAYQCKNGFIQTEAIHKLRVNSAASATKLWSGKAKGSYGLAWSVWTIAASKSVTCNHTGASYYCMAKGKPCLYVVP
jgi:hypothetical protein